MYKESCTSIHSHLNIVLRDVSVLNEPTTMPSSLGWEKHTFSFRKLHKLTSPGLMYIYLLSSVELHHDCIMTMTLKQLTLKERYSLFNARRFHDWTKWKWRANSSEDFELLKPRVLSFAHRHSYGEEIGLLFVCSVW